MTPKQAFTLPDTNVDTTTIKVTVSPSSTSTALTVYEKVTDVLDITGTSEVFFLQEAKGGKFQVYFGNNIVGKKLADGSVINVNYLVTNGSVANKVDGFIMTAAIGGYTTSTIDVVSVASGGSERETVDEIKAASPLQVATQKRLGTKKD